MKLLYSIAYRLLIFLGCLLFFLGVINLLHDAHLGYDPLSLLMCTGGLVLSMWAWISLSDLKMRAVTEEMLERIRRIKAADASFAQWGERVDAARGTCAAEGRERLDFPCK